MPCRGIRGAITVEHNRTDEILEATSKLLSTIIEKNTLMDENLVQALYAGNGSC